MKQNCENRHFYDSDGTEHNCKKCGISIEMPKRDGPFEYYESNEGKYHGQNCPHCGWDYCDKCGDWHKTDNDGTTYDEIVCGECFEG